MSYVILVVEDERPLQEVIKTKLEYAGCEVVTCRSGEQAEEYLGAFPRVDAIWLDHYLIGKEDGLSFVARIKEPSSKYKHVPIFVVSNTATNDKVQSYIHLGIDKYYVKSNSKLDGIVEDILTFLRKS